VSQGRKDHGSEKSDLGVSSSVNLNKSAVTSRHTGVNSQKNVINDSNNEANDYIIADTTGGEDDGNLNSSYLPSYIYI
jgi:hypothetical protein